MKPILFCTDMVLSVLDEIKTQTRRTINPQPKCSNSHEDIGYDIRLCEWAKEPFNPKIHNGLLYCANCGEYVTMNNNGMKLKYQINDILYARETWQHTECLNLHPTDENCGYIYKASENGQEFEHNFKEWQWKPSLFMPKEAARIFLKITNIRIERVADISEEDAKNEGVLKLDRQNSDIAIVYRNYLADNTYFQSHVKHLPNYVDENIIARESYRSLWQKLNGTPKVIQQKVNGKTQTVGYIVYPFSEEDAEIFEGKSTWKDKPLTVITNPWVFVYDFEIVKK